MRSHDSDLAYHVHMHVFPRLRIRNCIRSLPRSMASVSTHYCVVVVHISSDRSEDLYRSSRGHTGTVVVLLGQCR